MNEGAGGADVPQALFYCFLKKTFKIVLDKRSKSYYNCTNIDNTVKMQIKFLYYDRKLIWDRAKLEVGI